MEIEKALEKASEAYIEKTKLRASVQVIPYIGGALDTLFSGKGNEIQQRRIDNFLVHLDERLKILEGVSDIEANEEFLDLFTSILEGVVKTRSELKRNNFASIVSNQIKSGGKWEEAETVARLLKELDEIHIKVLIFTMSAPVCSSGFSGLRVVTIIEEPLSDENEQNPTSLIKAFPEYSVGALRMVCSELVAKALLSDEGIGRVSTQSLTYFISNDFSKWFTGWISK